MSWPKHLLVQRKRLAPISLRCARVVLQISDRAEFVQILRYLGMKPTLSDADRKSLLIISACWIKVTGKLGGETGGFQVACHGRSLRTIYPSIQGQCTRDQRFRFGIFFLSGQRLRPTDEDARI